MQLARRVFLRTQGRTFTQAITRHQLQFTVCQRSYAIKTHIPRATIVSEEQQQADDTDPDKSFDSYLNLTEEQRKRAIKILTEQGTKDRVEDDSSLVRLTKYLARMGVCSRRQGEEYIKSGVVKVNGNVITDVGYKLGAGDRVQVQGFVISEDKMKEKITEPKLYAFYKQRAVLCSRVDSKNPRGEARVTLSDELHKMGFGHLMAIGRLDYNSEGLLLLTNDGDLKRHMELPGSNIEREYIVRVHGRVTQEHLDQFRRGAFNVDGRDYGPIKAEIRTQMNDKTTWLRVLMYEGKNREIRKVFQHFNMPVSRLVRVRYGPYELGDMPKGNIRTLPIKAEHLKHCNQQFVHMFTTTTNNNNNRKDSNDDDEADFNKILHPPQPAVPSPERKKRVYIPDIRKKKLTHKRKQ